jgi:hypothetical protein
MVDQYSGADIGIKLAAAIADSNCTAKIFDMTGMGSGTQTLSGNVSLSIAGAKYLWPNARINMGSNQIIVPVGVHDVSMFGVSSSASDSGLGQKATYFNYTGNAAAIVVGDASANTFAFHAGLFAVNLSGAGANAIGIQLNRAIDYTLEPVRVGTNAFATTYGIDLEGSGNYTGGTMIHPWISYVDGEAIHFGTNANANTIIGAHLEGGGAGHGIGFNFAGTAGGYADGNLILGGDSENCNISLNYDRANNNAVFGLRTEGCTTAANTTANAQQNHAFTTGSNGMAVNDIGSNNSFTDAYWTQLGRSTWKMKSGADVSSLLVMNSGLTIEQIAEIQLLGLTDGWKITKDNAAGFKISHNASTPAGISHLHFTSNSFINSESAGAVLVNDEANTGTGGFSGLQRRARRRRSHGRRPPTARSRTPPRLSRASGRRRTAPSITAPTAPSRIPALVAAREPLPSA